MLRQTSHSLSHLGNVRELNEDVSFCNPEAGLWAVADGMGGHDAGELASRAIADALASMPVAAGAQDLNAHVHTALQSANATILRLAAERGNGTMGSTVVVLLTFQNAFRCLWSGDSRAYLLRRDKLHRITKDHTEVQELIDRGVLTAANAENYPRRNVILHAIGVDAELYLDHVDGNILPGDTFLLCSDGLTAHIGDLEILRIASGLRPEQICAELLDLTLFRGGSDNVTITAVQFFSSSATIPGGPLPASCTNGGN
jgi:serine/threonine protein phosphatase PrpC